MRSSKQCLSDRVRKFVRAAVVCPKTDALIIFEAPGGEAKLADMWQSTFELACPTCGRQHEIGGAQAYKQGVMAQFDIPVECAAILH